ncbi:hypothetical protein [Fervidobacterium thailandense]|uniref:Uncharacterized protein n=1 Tax=Fervidobacterium thailandense TaxID=1008305 RepID=A0A1E3G3K2_9BACT|nr:hypothetical protein [Fervidobacterium thailandense]ODN30393.1 hypothetical protein A4H02_05980 [Fervidobacterium thailandense]
MLKATYRMLVAFVLLISVYVCALQLSIPQGMNFVLHVRISSDLITTLNDGHADENVDPITEVVNLPEMITVIGKFSSELELSDWESLLSDTFDLETVLSSLRKLPIIFVFPRGTQFESVENFLTLFRILYVQFDEKSEKYATVITEEGVGHLYKLETGVYLTFSDTMVQFLELFSESTNYSKVLEIPDDVLVYYEAIDVPILGTVFYLLGDVYGTPQSEKGYIKICDDQSVEIGLTIKKEISPIERKLISKLTSITKHFVLENATIRFMSVEPFNALVLKSITPLTLSPIEPKWVESVALSLLTDEDEENTQMALSIKPKAAYEDRVFSAVAHLPFLLELKDGFVLIRTGNAVLTRANNVVADGTILHAELFNMKISIAREGDDVTKVSVKFPNISDFLKLLDEELRLPEGEDIYSEEPDYPFEIPEEELMVEEDEEENQEESLTEVLSEIEELTYKFAVLINSFIQSMCEDGDWNVSEVMETVGISTDNFDFVQLTDKDGVIHAMFVFYFGVDDESTLLSVMDHFSNLLNTNENTSLSISPVGSKLVVIIHLLK